MPMPERSSGSAGGSGTCVGVGAGVALAVGEGVSVGTGVGVGLKVWQAKSARTRSSTDPRDDLFMFKLHMIRLSAVAAEYLEVFPLVLCQINEHLASSESVNQIVCPDGNLADTLRDDNPALTASEGLLPHMGVEKQTREGGTGIRFQHGTVGRDHIPAICIILPAGVRVFHLYGKGPMSGRVPTRAHK